MIPVEEEQFTAAELRDLAHAVVESAIKDSPEAVDGLAQALSDWTELAMGVAYGEYPSPRFCAN